MNVINAFLIYAQEDAPRMKILYSELKKTGIQLRTALDMLRPGDNYASHLAELITSEKNIVIFISEKVMKSFYVKSDIDMAFRCARERDKNIILIVDDPSLLEKNADYAVMAKDQKIILLTDGLHSENSYSETAGMIYDALYAAGNKELLYEKISNLMQIQYSPGVVKNVCLLVDLLNQELRTVQNSQERRGIYIELLRCMVLLKENYILIDDGRELVQNRLDASRAIVKCINSNNFQQQDLFLFAVALQMIGLEWHILGDAIVEITHDDYHGVPKEETERDFLPRQRFFLSAFDTLMAQEQISDSDHGRYTEDEFNIILHAKDHLIYDDDRSIAQTDRKKTTLKNRTEEEQHLYEIADHMRESNRLFETLSNQNLAIDFMRCLRTSYERLKRYSEIVGCMDICGECIEQIAEINQKLENATGKDSCNSIAENGFKALLGVGIVGIDDYDVFLSYKHEDKDIADKLYHFLKQNLLNTFYDSASLPELSKSEYEDAIMSAIDHSKHFVVVLSDLEYLKSHWVTLEMKTFHHEMVEGRKVNSNFIIVVTDNVYEEIRRTNKITLPIQYRGYEIMRVGEYRNVITKYFI